MSDDGFNDFIPPSREVEGEDTRRKMIVRWQAAHLHRGVSLTNPDVNTGLRVTVETMDLLIQGMHANGGISAEQMSSLRWWLGTAIAAADEFGG